MKLRMLKIKMVLKWHYNYIKYDDIKTTSNAILMLLGLHFEVIKASILPWDILMWLFNNFDMHWLDTKMMPKCQVIFWLSSWCQDDYLKLSWQMSSIVL